MSSASDFVIENGVLKKYVGPGGDVAVPKGVTVIGEEAFSNDKNVVNIRLPYGIRITKRCSGYWSMNGTTRPLLEALPWFI